MEEAALIRDAGMEGGEETLASLLPMPLLPAPSIDKPPGTSWQESLCRTERQACAKALWLKEQAGAVPKRARASVARRRKDARARPQPAGQDLPLLCLGQSSMTQSYNRWNL